MALQSTVSQFQPAGARGLVANAETRNLISRSRADDDSVDLGFGEPAYRVNTGDGDAQCSALAASGDFLGLTRRVGTIDPANTPVDTFAQNDEVPLLTQGVIWVETADAVVAGAVANFNTTTRLWTDAAVAGSIIAVPGCEFDSTATAAGLAKLRVQRVVPA